MRHQTTINAFLGKVWPLVIWCHIAAASADPIRAKAVDIAQPLCERLAAAYATNHPGFSIKVESSSVDSGIKALVDRDADLLFSTRPLRPPETARLIAAFARRPIEYKLAVDVLSVFVPARSAIQELSLDQIRGLFSGQIRNWRELGGDDLAVSVYVRNRSSSAYEFFSSRILKGEALARLAIPVSSTAQMVQAVASDPKAIGFGGIANVRSVRMVKIVGEDDRTGVELTEQTAAAGVYPLARYMVVLLNPEMDRGKIDGFLDWVRGTEGQKVVKQSGFIPLPQTLRER